MKMLLGLILTSVTIATFTYSYIELIERAGMADQNRATRFDRICQ